MNKIDSTSSTMEDTKRLEEQAYQQRLDNVLSKFNNKCSKGYIYCDNDKITISSKDNKFYIVEQEISLETVESLLKDLEAE